MGILYCSAPTTFGRMNPSEAIKALQRLCQELSSVGGRFIQTVQDPVGDRTWRETGVFAWIRPDRLWWAYERPDRKVLVWTQERLEFYIEEECTVYYDDARRIRASRNPFLAIVRDCVLDPLAMEVVEFERRGQVWRWQFQALDQAEDAIPWAQVSITWWLKKRIMEVITKDWLGKRVQYRLKLDDVTLTRAQQHRVWWQMFPTECERIPLSRLQPWGNEP